MRLSTLVSDQVGSTYSNVKQAGNTLTNDGEENESDPDRPIRALRKVSIYALVLVLVHVVAKSRVD